eukprot:15460831-Alexandrium_andersonii.AAC.2
MGHHGVASCCKSGCAAGKGGTMERPKINRGSSNEDVRALAIPHVRVFACPRFAGTSSAHPCVLSALPCSGR